MTNTIHQIYLNKATFLADPLLSVRHAESSNRVFLNRLQIRYSSDDKNLFAPEWIKEWSARCIIEAIKH